MKRIETECQMVFENLKPNQTAATDSPFKTNECTKLFQTPHQKLKNEKRLLVSYELSGNRI